MFTIGKFVKIFEPFQSKQLLPFEMNLFRGFYCPKLQKKENEKLGLKCEPAEIEKFIGEANTNKLLRRKTMLAS